MRLSVIGSGNASNAAGRRHSSYWIEGALDEGALMIDCGGTSLQGIKELGFDPRRLRVLAFTHLHGDHMGGYPFLIVDALYDLRREDPLVVVGPPGSRERLEGALALCYPSIAKRERPFRLDYVEIAPGEQWEGMGASVRAFAADHQEAPEVSLCLRVQGADRSTIAFSGDTRICEGLFEAARDADLLVAECSALEPPCGAHSTWVEWQEHAKRLGRTELVLTHLGEDVRSRTPELLEQGLPGVAALAFADDGLTFCVAE